MNEVISGRDVVIVVASVLIGGGVTSKEGLGDEKSVTGAITGGVDVTVCGTVLDEFMGSDGIVGVFWGAFGWCFGEFCGMDGFTVVCEVGFGGIGNSV
ncbi:hypothetical protein Tco_0585224 [Tanacetum coccineum]